MCCIVLTFQHMKLFITPSRVVRICTSRPTNAGSNRPRYIKPINPASGAWNASAGEGEDPMG